MEFRPRWLTASLVLALSPLLAACGSEANAGSDSTNPSTIDLTGPWQLTAGTLHGVDLDLAGGRTITLAVRDGQASGSSACNTYGGTAKVDGQSIQFRELGGTEMACDSPVMDLEQAYLQALGTVETAERSGESLILTGPSVRLTYDAVAPDVDRDLIGTTWVLDTLIEGEVASSSLFDANIILQADGSLTGFTGCPAFTGSYELDGDQLRMRILAESNLPCPYGSQFSQILDVLTNTVTVLIDGSALTLTTASGNGLGYHAESPVA